MSTGIRAATRQWLAISRMLGPHQIRFQEVLAMATVRGRHLSGQPEASVKDHQPPVPEHIKAIADSIARLKFYEVTLLNECLRKTLNIPDAPMMVGSVATPADEQEEGPQSAGVKSSFTVKLTKFDDTKKVALIKEIKKLVEGINLVEAKRFVEDCPKVIRANLSKDEAEELKSKLEAAGGTVSVD